ncbi:MULTISPECIES: polyamine aminopropyltransferase [unclassified Oceanobacter]|jgi:spermidine synthase|uniref:polyamine aminopropyltransferase n=1 Tax=unclassified Oceanobacter TaxID=2620260 RepID=UPI0026E1E780|nr:MULTISPECIES: polyamine aminopropyltransferase [unclassified Oceanobacter]MDO6682142.1 polyamine aminopropyltransferase [Oceanobacter sp. 5_MG-2023]MDP2548607.1 polyamine aminopropyltransferase [Oceanobacter sp. 4_MG-2023]MDP2610372.1 polyamine aminopropyltransferase [Oceanobacter sp. 1_MG-2023]MDP2613618.1 polyamine aminopropyltransferase [Oceanobacter sp. 2_MG-2023]
MTHSLADGWFTEVFDQQGSAFSLKVKGKIDSVQSEFQRIDIYDTETFGKLMVIDGCTMVSTRENFVYHEMMSHIALFAHPAPKNVAIIGGGDCGTLREVLKHPGVEQVWQIDIDELVTRMSEQHFPELCESNADPRANILFADGIQWIKDRAPESLDVIIIDSTDPVGPAEGLFAIDFYKDCFTALAPLGIVVQQSESPLYHSDSIIKKIHVDMAAAGATSSHTVQFPQVIYPSGWWSCTLASKGGDTTSFRIEDAAAKPFRTEYYNAEIHAAGMAMPEFMRRALNIAD